MRHLKLPLVLDAEPSHERDRALALIASRILEPASKLATSRSLRPETCHHSLGESLQLGALNEDDLYAAMDWLVARQPQSKPPWPAAICGRARWCCTI